MTAIAIVDGASLRIAFKTLTKHLAHGKAFDIRDLLKEIETLLPQHDRPTIGALFERAAALETTMSNNQVLAGFGETGTSVKLPSNIFDLAARLPVHSSLDEDGRTISWFDSSEFIQAARGLRH